MWSLLTGLGLIVSLLVPIVGLLDPSFIFCCRQCCRSGDGVLYTGLDILKISLGCFNWCIQIRKVE